MKLFTNVSSQAFLLLEKIPEFLKRDYLNFFFVCPHRRKHLGVYICLEEDIKLFVGIKKKKDDHLWSQRCFEMHNFSGRAEVFYFIVRIILLGAGGYLVYIPYFLVYDICLMCIYLYVPTCAGKLCCDTFPRHPSSCNSYAVLFVRGHTITITHCESKKHRRVRILQIQGLCAGSPIGKTSANIGRDAKQWEDFFRLKKKSNWTPIA